MSIQQEHAAAVRELLHRAKILAADYYALTGKPLGITGEVAEFEAAGALNLTLAPPRQPDYDAFLTKGDAVVERYQVKGRAVDPTDRYRGRVPSIQYDRDFESVLLVILDRSTYSVLEIWQASRPDVRDRLTAPGSKARNERNSMGISQFLSIARKVWPEDERTDASTNPKSNEELQEKMTREAAICHATRQCKDREIHGYNTCFSNINVRKDVWWIDVPISKIEGSSAEVIHFLLYDGRNQPEFHHLMVPTSYLKVNIDDFRRRHDKDTIHLELSVSESNLFQDVVGTEHVSLAQFRHCAFKVATG